MWSVRITDQSNEVEIQVRISARHRERERNRARYVDEEVARSASTNRLP